MKLVLPVSHVDLETAKLLAARIVALGGMQEEHVIVISTMKAAWDVAPLIATLQPGFRETTLHVLTDEDETGWPTSAGHLFVGAATYLEGLDNNEPWMYTEADCFPLCPGWFQELRDEYVVAGEPYQGVINVSRFEDPPNSGQLIEDGQHMVGGAASVYPADFMRSCASIEWLPPIPWDVHCGPEIVPQCHHTACVAHRWNTCDYRYEGNQLVCDNVPHLWTQYAAPIPPDTIIIHGDKSQSLYQLFPEGKSWV